MDYGSWYTDLKLNKEKNMKIKTFNNYLDYINSDVNNWSYVTLNDFKKAQNKKVKVYFDKQNNEINVVLTERGKDKNDE
jgi:hypothetical protein